MDGLLWNYYKKRNELPYDYHQRDELTSRFRERNEFKILLSLRDNYKKRQREKWMDGLYLKNQDIYMIIIKGSK